MSNVFGIKNGDEILGWLSEEDAGILLEFASKAPINRVLELGSFVGKSAVVLGEAMRKEKGTLICIDYFADNMVFESGGIKQVVTDTREAFWQNIKGRGLEGQVLALKGDYKNILPILSGSFGLVFIDGGHDFTNTSFAAEQSWRLLVPGGFLVFHDYNNRTWPDVKACVDDCLIKWGRKFVRQSANSNLVVIQK